MKRLASWLPAYAPRQQPGSVAHTKVPTSPGSGGHLKVSTTPGSVGLLEFFLAQQRIPLNPPCSEGAFVVSSEPRTGALPSVRVCGGLMALRALRVEDARLFELLFFFARSCAFKRL
jgi:hypothetical protein